MYKQKVSLSHKIPKIWFSEPHMEPKIGSEPGSTEPVSRYVLTLPKCSNDHRDPSRFDAPIACGGISSPPDSIPPRNRPIHLSQFAKYLSVIKTVAATISDGGCADDGMSVLPAAELAISFNPQMTFAKMRRSYHSSLESVLQSSSVRFSPFDSYR